MPIKLPTNYILPILKQKTIYNRRPLFHWLNIVFNQVDEQRREIVGPDRSCAEWLLRNGAGVKWIGAQEYLNDYNTLPKEEIRFFIEEVDATDCSINHYGFDHFKDCKYIRKVRFVRCQQLQNVALAKLEILKESLEFLQISSCLNITDEGLKHLVVLKKLKHLILENLQFVKDEATIVGILKNHLVNCKINFI